MRIEFHGLVFETPQVTCYLWSPWRASALEHRLFAEVSQLAGGQIERAADETCVHLRDAKVWRQAIVAITRVLKGWQEEASDSGRERRAWRWLLEGDTDDHGYDHSNQPACLWFYLRLVIDRGGAGPDDLERPEDIDLNGFGLRLWPSKS